MSSTSKAPIVLVKRSSAGLGLFAGEPIKKGMFIIEYVGRVISKEEEETSRSKYLFEVSRNKTIDGSDRSNIARYINHACKPNAEAEIKSGRVMISAIKNIAAGEEITYDYGKEYVDEHIKPRGCKCASCASKRSEA
jgi:SET domain-containing protein